MKKSVVGIQSFSSFNKIMLENDHQQLNIETHVLKLRVDCEGCKKKVTKLLKKIEGVYSVDIDTEQQMVTVSGVVDSATLMKKLAKSGKRAKLCSPSSRYQLLNQQEHDINQLQLLDNDLNATENQHMGNEFEVMGFGQSIGMKAVDAGAHLHLMATRAENACIDENNFAGNDRLEYNTVPMVYHADYEANEAGFGGLGGHEINGIPSYGHDYMINQQQVYHYNHP